METEEVMEPEEVMETDLEKYPDIYDAIRSDDWRKLIFFMENSPTSMEIIIDASTDLNLFGDLVINVLIAYEKTDLALDVIQFMDPEMLEMKNFDGDTALHMAAANGDISVTMALLDKNHDIISARNLHGETPLFKATLNGERQIFWEICLRGGKIKHRRIDGATVLHCALMTNNFELALEIAQAYPELVDLRDQVGLTALHLLVSSREAFRSSSHLGPLDSLLYRCIIVSNGPPNDARLKRDEEEGEVDMVGPTAALNKEEGTVDMASTVKKRFTFLESDEDIFDPGEKGDSNVIKKRLKKIFNPAAQWIRRKVDRILRMTHVKQDLIKRKRKHLCAKKLLSLIAKRQEYWWSLIRGSSPTADSASDQKYGMWVERRMETPLTLGIRMGFDQLVVRILKIYPRAAEYQGKEGKNVLHVAVETRRETIVNVITNVGTEMDRRLRSRLLSAKDDNGNTLLHLAAVAVDQTSSPFRMRGEFKWFEEVAKLLPSELVNHRNKEGKTAQGLFREKHEEMVKEGKDRITNMALTCSSIVAAVVFATGFSIPGESEQKGPAYLGKTAFTIFSHAYVVGLSCAVMTLVLFLTLVMSSYREEDFRRSLPIKYNLATISLFLAMLSMLVAYSCNIYLSIYGAQKTQIKDVITLVCELTIFPAFCLVLLACGGVKLRFLPFNQG